MHGRQIARHSLSLTAALLALSSIACDGESHRLHLHDAGHADAGETDAGETDAGQADAGVFQPTGLRLHRVSAGNESACAIDDESQVHCWGSNEEAQLGQGLKSYFGPAEVPPAVHLPGKALQVDGGWNHTCALLVDGSVHCWGGNANGQLGSNLGSVAVAVAHDPAEFVTVDLGAGAKVKQLSVSDNISCALLEDGHVKCWGKNDHGQLGLGSHDNRGDDAHELGAALPALDFGTGRTVQALSVYSDHGCAVLDDGSVKCWGANTANVLGFPPGLNNVDIGDQPGEMGDALRAVDIGAGERAKEVAVSLQSACALLESAKVLCWGEDLTAPKEITGFTSQPAHLGPSDFIVLDDGKLATADWQTFMAKNEPGDGHWVSADRIWYFGCALDSAGAVHCFDSNEDADGGTWGASLDHAALVQLGASATSVTVTNDSSACAVLSDGAVRCWGLNESGSLGIGETKAIGDDPTEAARGMPRVDLGPDTKATSVGVGFYHACALLTSGHVKCWGYGGLAELGLGDALTRGDEPNEMGAHLPAVDLGANNKVVELSVGGSHNCVILQDGAVKCWGDNDNGQLGLGDVEQHGDDPGEMGDALPKLELGGRKASALALGTLHSCALLEDGAVSCWGDYVMFNPVRPSDEYHVPHDVDLGGARAVAITSGNWHSCALLESGELKCWGMNDNGELGTLPIASGGGPFTPNYAGAPPSAELPTNAPVAQIAAGADITCAVLTNGNAHCWGGRDVSDVAGSTLTKPINFGAGRRVVELDGGSYFGCARLDNDEVKCWGWNSKGQLGTGDWQSRGDSALPLKSVHMSSDG